jgi:crotonobetaine/carnitine-CoA ligase
MHRYTEYFAHRHADDELDCVPLLAAGLRRDPARTVAHFDDEAITCDDIARHVAHLQCWFAEEGLAPGDRVAVMLGNSAAHVHLIYALVLSGLVWVPVNTKLRAAGVEYLVQHAEPKLLIIEDEFDAASATIDCGTTRRVRLPAFDTRKASSAFTSPDIGVHDPLCIIYTSGTTGAPKGVIFTHRMMRIAGEAALRVADVREGDRMFLWEPLCHIGGAQMLLLPFLETVSLHAVPRFSASQQIERAGATQLHYLGGVLDILMQLPPDAQPERHTLRVAWGAGVSASAWAPVQERLNVRLRECYGMTECSSFATANATGKPGSIGRALPWMEIELLDENGQPVKEGEAGEIVLSSKRAIARGATPTAIYSSSAGKRTACACAARTFRRGRSSASSRRIRPFARALRSAWRHRSANRISCSTCSSRKNRWTGKSCTRGRASGSPVSSCRVITGRWRASNSRPASV